MATVTLGRASVELDKGLAFDPEVIHAHELADRLGFRLRGEHGERLHHSQNPSTSPKW